MSDPYQILGVDKATATDESIKNAFRALAKEHHPDKHDGSAAAQAKFQAISIAYDDIKTAEKRQAFEMKHRGFGGPQPDGFGGFHFRAGPGGATQFDFDQILREFHRQHQQQARNRNYSTQCGITLLDSFRGCEVSLKLDAREIRVKVPAGVDNGTRIRVAGAGEAVHTDIPPGDLFVTIFVENDPRFSRNGKNLFSDVQMNVFDAILGGVVTVPTIDGADVDITIRQGAQHDHQTIISGRGMPSIGSDQRGDHIITVKLIVPTNLTDEQLELVKQIKGLPN